MSALPRPLYPLGKSPRYSLDRRKGRPRADLDAVETRQGARGSVVVKALCYKPEGRGFDTRSGDFFKFT
jgi:hypothetical protein